jgi:rRNA-processing protein CGR1
MDAQASGRPWKVPGERAGSFKNPLLSTTWEKKMKLKAERDAFKTVKRDAVAAHKEKLAVSHILNLQD